MTTARRMLGLDDHRWSRVNPASFWIALSQALGASFLFAFNRFGGLAFEVPRAFVRMTLVGVYGWLGLSLAIWLVLLAVRRREPVAQIVTVVGMAHLPVIALGLVIFISAGLARILGPGTVVAVFVLGFWFPASLTAALRYAIRLPITPAVAVVTVPYLVWLTSVGRHLVGQVEHLL